MELRVTRLADFDRVCCESWPLDVFLYPGDQDRHGGEVNDQRCFRLLKRVIPSSGYRWLAGQWPQFSCHSVRWSSVSDGRAEQVRRKGGEF